MIRTSLLSIGLLISHAAFASDVLLYEDFQDGESDGWRAFGSGTLSITYYEDNASLRMRGTAMAVTEVPTGGRKRVRMGASFAALDLRKGESCIAEGSIDEGESWFEILALNDGDDDGLTLHSGATTRDLPPDTQRAWIRARVASDQDKATCWLDNVYAVAPAAQAPAVMPRAALKTEFLLGTEQQPGPLPMAAFAAAAGATASTRELSGRLRLVSPESASGFRVVYDLWDRAGAVGEAMRHLPEFDFEFVQRGADVLPLERGVIRRQHPYWEIILQPGRAWDEAGDGDWTRVSIPFALQERAANCTHNGIMTWLLGDDGEVSRVAYQISSETCGYLKLDMWGTLSAEFEPADLSEAAAVYFKIHDTHEAARLPVRPLAQLAVDHPGVDPLGVTIADGIHPDDLTVYGIVVDGVHYRSNCGTRAGPYPYCDVLPLPSYSTAKSIFAGVATMRLEAAEPGVSQRTIASLIPACDSKKWRDVTIEHALDMTTGNYRSRDLDTDEYDLPHRGFIFEPTHEKKLKFACNHFRRKDKPGQRVVYHSSDTYLVGVALSNIVAPGDLYSAELDLPIWQRLRLSRLMGDAKRTYDEAHQPLTGWGLTYEADDIARVAAWLNSDLGRIDGEPMLDEDMLLATLQRDPGDRGLPAGSPNLYYNNGFWAYDAGPSLGCRESAWVPFMSGVSGITVAMFPNDVIYYYFSDSYTFRWQSAREVAQAIRRMCE